MKVLRAVYLWSERRYRREQLREALWRIHEEMETSRRGRALDREAAQGPDPTTHLGQTRHVISV